MERGLLDLELLDRALLERDRELLDRERLELERLLEREVVPLRLLDGDAPLELPVMAVDG